MMSLFEKVYNQKKLVLVTLLLLGFLTYWFTLQTGFLSDDFGFNYQMEKYGWNAFSHNFNDQFFIPLSHVIGTALYQILGPNAFAFHLIQLLIHILIGWQLYLLLVDYLSHSQKEKIALLAAILFVIFPYQTEAVIWLSSKSYGYSLLFGLLFIRSYFSYTKENKSIHLLLSCFWLLASIHSKEFGYVLPIVLFLMEWAKGRASNSIRPMLWFLLILVISLGVRWYILPNPIGGYGAEKHVPLSALPLSKNLIAYHLKFLAYPRYNWLFFILTGLTILTPLLLNQKLKLKQGLAIWFMFIVLILPVLSLEISSLRSIESDRYGYWASIIIATVLSISIFNLPFKKASLFLGAIWIVSFSYITTLTNQTWVEASELRDTYGEQLLTIEENIIVLNAPDNYKGVYVFRNGIEEYLKLHGSSVELTVPFFQTFHTLEGGITPPDVNHSVTAINCSELYYFKNSYGIVYPIEPNKVSIDEKIFQTGQNIYYFSNGKLHRFDHP